MTKYRQAVQRSMRDRLQCARIGGRMIGARFWNYRPGKGMGSPIRVDLHNEPWNLTAVKGD